MQDRIESVLKENNNKLEDEATINIDITITKEKTPIHDIYHIPYPRLAMWWLDVYEESAESISRYDLVLNEIEGDEDESTPDSDGHGSLGLFWFDEYDLGSGEKGYLGYPVADYKEVYDNVYIREFEHGLVLVNASENSIKPQFDIVIQAVGGFGQDDKLESFDGRIYIY